MRLDPRLLHPSILKAADRIAWSGGSSDHPEATERYQQAWFRDNGFGCFTYVFGCLALIAVVGLSLKGLGVARDLRVLAVTLMCGLALIVGGVLANRRVRRMSAADLATILPLLDLPETGRAYVETVVALDRSGTPPEGIAETMAALNALLDEESRLRALRERVVG